MISTKLRAAPSQVQVHRLSPQMRQSIAMLAKNLPELREELYREMASNPVIEDIEPTLERETVSQKERETELEDRAFDDGWEFGEEDGDGYFQEAPDGDALERRRRFFESRTKEETLEEHLTAQIALSDIEPRDAPLARLLVGELDGDGYFRGSMPDVVMVSGESEERIRAVLARISQLDPPGCGATTLEECLLAQLESLDGSPCRADVEAILSKRLLKDLAAGRIDETAAAIGATPERCRAALAAIRTLDPRPARAYGRAGKSVAFVNPEVRAVRSGGRWLATLDDRSLPEIRISPRYLKMLADPSIDAATKDYLREKAASADFLAQAVEKRRETVLAVSQAIFDAQPGFFEKGLKGLRPMTMQEIADRAGVHHTTVSRTVRDKYAATPRGTVELRNFFPAGVASEDGGEVARTTVLEALEALVAKESPEAPLSDAALSAALTAKGWSVARRTVAKYRGMLGIPGAPERKAPPKSA